MIRAMVIVAAPNIEPQFFLFTFASTLGYVCIMYLVFLVILYRQILATNYGRLLLAICPSIMKPEWKK